MILAALLACGATSAPAAGAAPSARSKHLAERFHFFCLKTVPDFQRINSQATALGLQLFEDRKLPVEAGQSIHQRNWLVPDPSGDFLLTSEDARKPQHVIGCGIAASDADGQDLMLALSKHAQVGMPIKQMLNDPATGKAIWWKVRIGGRNAQVLLAYDIPAQRGILLNLIYPQGR